jgi:hypothetical protein
VPPWQRASDSHTLGCWSRASEISGIYFACVQLEGKIAEAIKDAEKACEDGQAEDCATAWDEVEELSAAASHKKDAVCYRTTMWCSLTTPAVR